MMLRNEMIEMMTLTMMMTEMTSQFMTQMRCDNIPNFQLASYCGHQSTNLQDTDSTYHCENKRISDDQSVFQNLLNQI